MNSLILKNFYENNNLNYFEQFFNIKKDLNSNFNFEDLNKNYYNYRIILDYIKEIKNEEIEFSEIFDLLLNKEILNKENIKNFLYDFLNIILNIKTFNFKDSKFLYQKISKILNNENNYENLKNILNLLEIIYNVKNNNQNSNISNYFIFLENGCKLTINNKINYKIIFNLSFSFKCVFKEKNMIFKIDTEGAEWNSLNDLPEIILTQFKYIVIEYHFINLNEGQLYYNVIKKISKTHQAFYLRCHGRENIIIFGNNRICKFLEVSYIIKVNNNFDKDDVMYPIFEFDFSGPSDSEKVEFNINLLKLFTD